MGFSLSLFIFMPLLFLLSQLHPILTHSSPSMQPLCHHDESSALLQFKESFNIDESPSFYDVATNCQKVESWKVEGNKSDCCSWDGVECDEATGHVIGLDLSCSCLNGFINSNSSLFQLVHLQSLNLAFNDFFDSQISFVVGNLLRLTHLNLSSTGFSMQIPSRLSHLSKLSSLDLSGNFFLTESDLLRSLVQNFTSLEELLLSNVIISSRVPESLANLSSLTTLDLESCELHGEFPTRIFLLPNLRDLYLGGNENLTGQLPEFHSNNSLEVLTLLNTGFYGKLPTSIGNLKSLHFLSFWNCHFSGSIPPSLSNFSQLTFLDLSMNNLIGQIPSSLPRNMTQLTFLQLSHNNLEGTIPSSFSELKSIKTLDFSHNNLKGTIPSSFSELKSIETLDFSYNNLKGTIPSSFSEFKSIVTLDFSHNNLEGTIPSSFSELKSIVTLDFSHNNLEGTIPSSFSELKSIWTLDFSSNNLKGTIPSSFSELKSIGTLDFSDNNLEGTIPSSFSELKSIWLLDFSYNNLSGMQEFDMFLKIQSLTFLILSSNNNLTLLTNVNSNDTLAQFDFLELSSCNLQKFPDFLRNQNKLQYLDLADNNLRGLIPKWFCNVSIEALEEIYLSENFLIGFEQSPVVLLWSKLFSLDLGNNRLQGSLPIPPPSTAIYQVQRNLIREMSPLICNLSSLSVLDLSYNNLSGMLHPCLGNLSSSLFELQLQSNNFSGTIPKTWLKRSSLKMIDLSENQLQGQLPRSMANCTVLEYLHVGNNQINDTFPFWLGTLSQLKVLILHSNAFHGAIKSLEINYTFPELHIIDLSHNSFSEKLPTEYFVHWNAMKVVGANQLLYMEGDFSAKRWDGTSGGAFDYPVTMTNKGIKLKYEKIPNALRVIDFSSNRFEGEIPKLVGSLKGLQLLNLSNNALTGHIPSSLGNLTNIEAMDLSQNKLFGEIPPQLTQLFSLEYFDVSNNNLTGPIPHGNQFDTFQNSSFGGNPGLCGSPLSKKCGDFKYTPTPPLSDSPFEFGWKVIAIGYGCGFVIGLVIGKIVITRKYDWFVKIFGRM